MMYWHGSYGLNNVLVNNVLGTPLKCHDYYCNVNNELSNVSWLLEQQDLAWTRTEMRGETHEAIVKERCHNNLPIRFH